MKTASDLRKRRDQGLFLVGRVSATCLRIGAPLPEREKALAFARGVKIEVWATCGCASIVDPGPGQRCPGGRRRQRVSRSPLSHYSAADAAPAQSKCPRRAPSTCGAHLGTTRHRRGLRRRGGRRASAHETWAHERTLTVPADGRSGVPCGRGCGEDGPRAVLRAYSGDSTRRCLQVLEPDPDVPGTKPVGR
jgi:hypothetical protein